MTYQHNGKFNGNQCDYVLKTSQFRSKAIFGLSIAAGQDNYLPQYSQQFRFQKFLMGLSVK